MKRGFAPKKNKTELVLSKLYDEFKINSGNFDGLVKSPDFSFFVIPAPDRVRGKLQRESSDFNNFWMPDQVRHDAPGAFYDFINLEF